jgi:hypothetical protein
MELLPRRTVTERSAGLRGQRAWALATFLLTAACVPCPGEEAPPPPAVAEKRPPQDARAAISPEVLQLLRLFLSQDPREEARGAHALRRMGPAAPPQLRQWLDQLHVEAQKVKDLLAQLEGGKSAAAGRESLTVHDFFHQILLECRGHLRDGEPEKALPLAEAAALLDGGGPYAWELRRLARQARERLVSRRALEPSIEAEKLVYELVDRPKLSFRLNNHHSTPARIKLQKGVLGELDVLITWKTVSGGVKLEKSKLRIQAPPGVDHILIAPGKAWVHELDFSLGDRPPLAGAVVRVQLDGRFRPSEWAVEGIEQSFSLSLGETELWFVPPGELALCDRPLEKLGAALVFGKVEAFFIGGQLAVWAGEQDAHANEKLIETILASLEELDGARREVAIRLLEEATGKRLGPDPRRWQAWWAKLTAAK